METQKKEQSLVAQEPPRSVEIVELDDHALEDIVGGIKQGEGGDTNCGCGDTNCGC
ncbi:hypothetical protein ACLESO_35370 [Pyxidicoccus sp. 3LG]